MGYVVCSYGIIVEDDARYLMVQRRDTIAFLDFVRGKYNPYEARRLVANMADDERALILTGDFDDMWTMASRRWPCGRLYEAAKTSFVNARHLASEPFPQVEREWGFPKGRKNDGESDLDAALREFTEETGYPSDAISLLDIDPLNVSESFTRKRGARYPQTYFLARMRTSLPVPDVDPGSLEVSAVKWFTKDEVLGKVSWDHPERRRAFLRADALLSNVNV